ncbi:MAG: diphosphomevalonate decarboxylase [Saprospiraceae bacterium]|nr:diphosphomevalonate decarboxylase [Saprospiraceae bacterium]MDW8228747.1 diphosphomevalonate decarboxylase [Saprospiraceae bacterium]
MANYENPRLVLDSSRPPEPGRVTWRSPSNIAIVKYWGKHSVQLPRNPSISLTLTAACTDMTLEYALKEHPDPKIDLAFFFEDRPNEAFHSKVVAFLESITPIFPFLRQLKLTLRTSNSFPHSTGIASSASSMSALALCLCSLEHRFFQTLPDDDAFDRKASYVARLGSGSACRSIYPYAALWGHTPAFPGSSDECAVSLEAQLHPVFKTFRDDVLVVSAAEKAVSSRAGHALMEGNPFSETRYTQARLRTAQLLEALRSGDVETFGQIAEGEALALHALMMCSQPPYLLLQPNTVAILHHVRAFRQETRLPVYFTLDAGPNVHLLYPAQHADAVRPWVESALKPLCENNFYLADSAGEGPEEL